MNKCNTCELYETIKFDKKALAKRINSDPSIGFRFRTIIRCCIRTDGYRIGEGWKNHAGSVTYGARPLRYCPECGRRLKK